MAFSLSRNARLFVSTLKRADISAGATAQDVVDNFTSDNTWQIPVLDGFSFSQETDTEEITVSEAGTTPDRGQQVFTTALQPVNWSFTNYMRPRSVGANADAVERIMWEALAAHDNAGDQNPITTTISGHGTTINVVATGMIVDFDSSDANQLLKLSLFWDLGGSAYLIEDVVVDQAELDFSIESIASIAWTGFGNTLTEVTLPADFEPIDIASAPDSTKEYVAAPTDNACIRNKLSTVTQFTDLGTAQAYQFALTAGTLTVSNNVTFLTPEALGVVNLPCDHFTGSRTINGTFTAYLKSGTSDDTAQMLSDLLADANSATPTITQNFDIQFIVGGTTGETPIVQIDMPHSHVVIPVVNVEDVFTVDIGFNALPFDEASAVNDFDLAQTNEMTVTYLPE